MSEKPPVRPVVSHLVAVGVAAGGWSALVVLLIGLNLLRGDDETVRRAQSALWAAGLVGLGLVMLLAPVLNAVGTRGRHSLRAAAFRGGCAIGFGVLLVLSALFG